MKQSINTGGVSLFLGRSLFLLGAGLLPVSFLTLSVIAVLPVQATTGNYSIQIGAYQDLANAVAATSRMERTGERTFLRHETTKDKGTWYRAYVGRFGSKTEAEKKARELTQAGFISSYYVRPLFVKKDAGFVFGPEGRQGPVLGQKDP